jgi:hypothetical protein
MIACHHSMVHPTAGTRRENPFTKPLIVIVMMAIVLLGAMTLAHAVKRHGQVVHEVVKRAVQVQAARRFPCTTQHEPQRWRLFRARSMVDCD